MKEAQIQSSKSGLSSELFPTWNIDILFKIVFILEQTPNAVCPAFCFSFSKDPLSLWQNLLIFLLL